jgi:phage protein D
MAKARSSRVQLSIDGVDITSSINQDLISLRYVDSEEDEADDIQITLQDREGRWMNAWLDDTLIAQLNTDAGAPKSKGLAINAKIHCENWVKPGDSLMLDCGRFALDSIAASGPPHRITIKGTSLPDNNGIRTTERSKSWENYKLSGVGKEIASRSGLGFIFDSGYDPTFARKEQNEQTDIAFLKRLCNHAGCSLKISHGRVIIFDQEKYERASVVAAIYKGDGSYLRYDLRSSQSDVDYTHCVVRYLNPKTGKLIEGQAFVPDYDEEGDQRGLVVSSQKVSSVAEANILAEKLLRMKNKFEKTGRFTMIGNPSLVASEVIALIGWGAFNGRFVIRRTVHDITQSGYKTDIELRNVL